MLCFVYKFFFIFIFFLTFGGAFQICNLIIIGQRIKVLQMILNFTSIWSIESKDQLNGVDGSWYRAKSAQYMLFQPYYPILTLYCHLTEKCRPDQADFYIWSFKSNIYMSWMLSQLIINARLACLHTYGHQEFRTYFLSA